MTIVSLVTLILLLRGMFAFIEDAKQVFKHFPWRGGKNGGHDEKDVTGKEDR